MSKPAGSQLVMAAVCVAALYGGQTFGAAPGVGDPAPEIKAGPWINGGPVSIAGSKGHVVVLVFFATW
jgi:hypothetical protein